MESMPLPTNDGTTAAPLLHSVIFSLENLRTVMPGSEVAGREDIVRTLNLSAVQSYLV
jgi:hypothetical protein